MVSDKREFLCEFIRKNQEDLYRFAYSYVKNREDALDILQESIVKALEAADRLKNIESVKPWMLKIIINEANGIFRKGKRTVKIKDYEKETAVFEYKDDIAEYINKQDMLKNIFELEDKYRIVIILRYYEELKISEIAKTLGIKENTVKTRLYKALGILKRTLGD